MGLVSIVSYIISGLLIFASLFVAEGSHLNLLYFWDLSSFIVILAGFFIILVNFRFSEVFNAVADALSRKNRQGFEDRYELDKIVINSIGSYTLSAAILVTILAFIILMGNLQDVSKLGPSLALTSITLLYAVIVKVFFVTPLNTSLDKKMTQLIK